MIYSSSPININILRQAIPRQPTERLRILKILSAGEAKFGWVAAR